MDADRSIQCEVSGAGLDHAGYRRRRARRAHALAITSGRSRAGRTSAIAKPGTRGNSGTEPGNPGTNPETDGTFPGSGNIAKTDNVPSVPGFYTGICGEAHRNDVRAGGLPGIRRARTRSAQEPDAVFAHDMDAGARAAAPRGIDLPDGRREARPRGNPGGRAEPRKPRGGGGAEMSERRESPAVDETFPPLRPTHAGAEDYGTSSIKLLKGLEAVRKRPGMYIGNTDDISGLHHMVTELVDNAIDEAQAGYCDTISVVVHADDSVTVEDNGRGIPVGPHPVLGRETLEIILMDLHSGGKFDDNAYKVSGGLHGVGLSVVNALAGSLEVEIKREGRVFQQNYAQGVPLESIREVGKTAKTGTKITYKADPEIFSVTSYNFDVLSQRLRELAFLNPGVAIDILDERDPKGEKKHQFRYDGGIRSFVEHLNKNKQPLHESVITFSDVKDPSGNAAVDAKKERLDVALQWNEGYTEQ